MDEIRLERRRPVAMITLNRPERLNAITVPQMRDGLAAALTEVDADSDVRVLILTGAGERAFSVGWDLASLGDPVQDYDDATLARVLEENADALLRIWEIRQPVIAAINGYALGAGATLALLCDLAVAAEGAQLGEPEIRHWALAPILLYPYLMPPRPAHLFTYTGEAIPAAELLRLGLVNAVVPDGQLADAARELAERIARVPPEALEAAKRSLKEAYERMGFREAQRRHRSYDAALLRADMPEKRRLLRVLREEGVKAFLRERDG